MTPARLRVPAVGLARVRALTIGAVAVSALVVLGGDLPAGSVTPAPAAEAAPVPGPLVATVPGQADADLARAAPVPGHRPVRLRIRSLGVAAAVTPLHLNPAGGLPPPGRFDRVGWYAAGPAPGDIGPAVLVGHVDSYVGPAVFARLLDLSPGSAIDVVRADGSSVSFRVTGTMRFPKHRFPTTKVYGPVPDVALRLVTCGGRFDATRRSYVDNVIVFAVAR